MSPNAVSGRKSIQLIERGRSKLARGFHHSEQRSAQVASSQFRNLDRCFSAMGPAVRDARAKAVGVLSSSKICARSAFVVPKQFDTRRGPRELIGSGGTKRASSAIQKSKRRSSGFSRSKASA